MLIDYNTTKLKISYKNRTHTFCGSMAYLAPEMAARTGHNLSLDWYLFGVLIYEMLSGKSPYFNPDIDTLFENILNARLRFYKC